GLGAGQPLSASDRAFFEPRFGRDFGHVRVHDDATAHGAAAAMQARAFTRGSHIAFGVGERSADTSVARRLLAHELPHGVQQGRGGATAIQRALATPEPATPPAAQAELTPEQIKAALRFNQSLYDATRTKQIQDLIGTEPTGTWTDEDVVAVASLQEKFGL